MPIPIPLTVHPITNTTTSIVDQHIERTLYSLRFILDQLPSFGIPLLPQITLEPDVRLHP